MRIKFYKTIIALLIITCINTASDNVQNDIINIVKKDVTKFFVNKYKVQSQDVNVTFKRLPNDFDESSNYMFRISNSNKPYKPGYQTLWVEVYKSNIYKMKFPVSIDISVQKKVAVATKKINRNQKLTSEFVEIKKQSINTNPNELFSTIEELTTFESAKYIKPGSIITMQMVRIPPTLKKGDNVEIRVNSGHLFVSTPGIANEDGYLGEDIKVICKNSRKKLKGVVQSSNLVLITNNGY